MANMSNCTLISCDQRNISKVEQVDMEMVRQDLVEFGFNDLFNVVAYSVMSAGKRHKFWYLRHPFTKILK
jgi:hypothetical protein